jgi:hypothetical protein
MATSVYQQGGYGTAGLFPNPVITNRSPTTSDLVSPTGQPYQIFQGWYNTSAQLAFIYLGGGNWIQIASSSGDLQTINSLPPTAGNIVIAGTANQIAVANAGSTVTLSIPSNPQLPGTVTAATGFTATTGNIQASNGNLVLNMAGNKLVIATGANASTGVSGAMSGTPGTVTVTSSAVTTSSVIIYSRATSGGTLGQVSITAQPAGSFTLTSTGNETSTFNDLISN